MLTNILFVNKVSANPLLASPSTLSKPLPTMTTAKPHVVSLFHADTSTFTHVVYDREGGHGAIVDPVRDFDPASGRIAHTAAEEVVAVVQQLNLRIDWILETHAHADHLSAAPYLKARLGGRIAIGRAIGDVQAIFEPRFHPGAPLPAHGPEGDGFDHLFDDGEAFAIGDLQATAWHVPGHTPADVAFVVGDAVFVGDTLFPPDVGTARCDFPGGDARTLYRSINKVLSLPPETKLYMCHDYQPNGRPVEFVTTVAEERASNIHVRDGISEDEFVGMRSKRDATLDMPVLILPSVQVNMRAGHLPEAEDNGMRYLKIPLNAL